MSTRTRTITTGQLISIATGRLCCPMSDVYECYNFLTGDNLMTHQLLRAAKICEPILQKQFPWLGKLATDECNRDNWREWLAKVEAAHGTQHQIAPLPRGVWLSKNPITEAIEIFGKDKVSMFEMNKHLAGHLKA